MESYFSGFGFNGLTEWYHTVQIHEQGIQNGHKIQLRVIIVDLAVVHTHHPQPMTHANTFSAPHRVKTCDMSAVNL